VIFICSNDIGGMRTNQFDLIITDQKTIHDTKTNIKFKNQNSFFFLLKTRYILLAFKNQIFRASFIFIVIKKNHVQYLNGNTFL